MENWIEAWKDFNRQVKIENKSRITNYKIFSLVLRHEIFQLNNFAFLLKSIWRKNKNFIGAQNYMPQPDRKILYFVTTVVPICMHRLVADSWKKLSKITGPNNLRNRD